MYKQKVLVGKRIFEPNLWTITQLGISSRRNLWRGLEQMIIRSQNKETLIDTTSLEINLLLNNCSSSYKPGQTEIIAFHTNDLASEDFLTLASYSTKEKALQVLDSLSLEIEQADHFIRCRRIGKRRNK
jgi:tRNA(His) 5'-end guanylyltransferase